MNVNIKKQKIIVRKLNKSTCLKNIKRKGAKFKLPFIRVNCKRNILNYFQD